MSGKRDEALRGKARHPRRTWGIWPRTRVVITYELPFAEIVFDFFDRLKSATRGYASMDYEVIDYRASNLVRLDILLNGEAVDALAVIVHKDKSYAYGACACPQAQAHHPRQMFEVAIQAAIRPEGHRPRDGFRLPQERHRQVLRR